MIYFLSVGQLDCDNVRITKLKNVELKNYTINGTINNYIDIVCFIRLIVCCKQHYRILTFFFFMDNLKIFVVLNLYYIETFKVDFTLIMYEHSR